MLIIRQILSYFAVPNMRNMGSVSRIILQGILALLFFPLLMPENNAQTYFELVFDLSSWAAPVLLIIMITGYFSATFFQDSNNKYAVVIAHILHMVIFILIDFVVLGTRGNFWQHFWIMNCFSLLIMGIEAHRRMQLSPALSEARLNALTARIRPHFLFNSLNAAISLIRLRPYDAETLLENLANLFRAQLRDASKASTLGQEIEWAQEYIAIEQIRMGHTRLQITWQHNAPDDAQTPHLFLQPLLENSVFHGIESSHRPGCINVFTSRKNNWIYIRIENPSIPVKNALAEENPRKSNSMALQNLKERLSLMYDNDAVIKSQQRENIFRVDIRLPYRAKESSHMHLFD